MIPPGADPPLPGDATSLAVARFLARARAELVVIALAAAGVASVALGGRRYVSEASFIPQARVASALPTGALAALGLPTAGDPTNNPAFFVELATSREVVDSVLLVSPFQPSAVARALGAADSVAPAALERLRRRLRRRLRATYAQRTSVVRITASMPSADVAREAVERIVNALDRFSQERRREAARANTQYAREREAEVYDTLRARENALREFLQRNRITDLSPSLTIERGRLERQVALAQQIAVGISLSYEQARLDALRDTPTITLIERPSTPARPDRSGLPIRLGLTLGAILGFLAAHRLARARVARG